MKNQNFVNLFQYEIVILNLFFKQFLCFLHIIQNGAFGGISDFVYTNSNGVSCILPKNHSQLVFTIFIQIHNGSQQNLKKLSMYFTFIIFLNNKNKINEITISANI